MFLIHISQRHPASLFLLLDNNTQDIFVTFVQ